MSYLYQKDWVQKRILKREENGKKERCRKEEETKEKGRPEPGVIVNRNEIGIA